MSGSGARLPTLAIARDSGSVSTAPGDVGVLAPGPQRGEKQRRHRHTVQQWGDLKERFEKLYLEEDGSLEDVKEALKRDYGFEASIRQYKNKIKEWGFEKHVKVPDMQILLAKRDKRIRDRGVKTVFVVNCVKLEDDRLNRFGKRESAKASVYVSPSADTPAGAYYYTPRSVIDAESPHIDTDDVFILQNAHHFRQVGPISIAQTRFEPLRTPLGGNLGFPAHAHQVAAQGIACRGRFSDSGTATKLLWQSHNFAIGLVKIMLEPGAAGEVPQAESSEHPLAPRFWVTPQGPEGLGAARVQRLIKYVKPTMLCKRLIGEGKQYSSRWLGDWRLMDETEIYNVETASRFTFGNPSLPYPEMEIFTLWVKLGEAAGNSGCGLLRMCFCIDPAQERQDCSCCHSICLVLDYMDPKGAVKLNVPLLSSSQRILDWAGFRDGDKMDKRTIQSTWRDVNYIFQGMKPIPVLCKRHKRTKKDTVLCCMWDSDEASKDETWDAEGRANPTFFEPFPRPEITWICPNYDAVHTREYEWDSDEDPLASDEEVFEPLATD